MAIRLRQSTASQEIPLGYFMDALDGNTEETGLTIANTDIKLWKMGATSLANKNSGGATHMANGIYYAVLDATDTNTLGALVVFVHVSGALAIKVECEVLTANNYDSLIGGTDFLQTDVAHWNNAAVPTPAAAGYPVVTHKVGTGTGEMNLSGGRMPADVTYWNGAAVATPATAGHPVVTHKVGTGTGEMNLSGGRTPADVTYWNGAAVATPATAGHPVVTHKVGTGTGELSISSGIVSADMTRVSGDSVAADNAESFFDGTGYAGTNNVIPVVGAVTGAVGSVTGNVGGNIVGSVGSVTGNVGGNVTGSVGSLAAQAKADVNGEVVDVLTTDTYAEPGSVPAATSSLKDKIGWLFMLARNKRTTSATQDKVRNDSDSADVGTAALNDDGTNFSRGEYV